MGKENKFLDLCCGQERHSLELTSRGFKHVTGIDRSKYLIRLARKRAKQCEIRPSFSEGDARNIKLKSDTMDCIYLMGNSFGYFEREEDDLAVLGEIKRVLKTEGKIFLDLVDGKWMQNHFEPRSWEWLDQNYFVCRERSLTSDKQRIISREIITHAELGVIADQFYAERLYDFEHIKKTLEHVGFQNVQYHGNISAESSRGQDLDMMANRLHISAHVIKQNIPKKAPDALQKITVLLGDPQLSDSVKRDGKFNEEDLATIESLKEHLEQLESFSFEYLSSHKHFISELSKNPPSFVLNLCDEGYQNKATSELHIPALLEMLDIPYTGAGPACLGLCYNKALIRHIANGLEIPVPQETYFDPNDQAANLPSIFPALLKPNLGDSSLGITKDAVVHNAIELMSYLDYLRQTFPGVPLLIQEFLEGTEYSVALIGNPGKLEALPLLEVDYSKLPANLPKILSYESKWLPDSPYWTNISHHQAKLDEETERRLIDASALLFERLECRDYARFDFRADKNGVIKLLEVNPNPGWCWDGKLNIMAGFKGLKYNDLLNMILNAARERIKTKS